MISAPADHPSLVSLGADTRKRGSTCFLPISLPVDIVLPNPAHRRFRGDPDSICPTYFQLRPPCPSSPSTKTRTRWRRSRSTFLWTATGPNLCEPFATASRFHPGPLVLVANDEIGAGSPVSHSVWVVDLFWAFAARFLCPGPPLGPDSTSGLSDSRVWVLASTTSRTFSSTASLASSLSQPRPNIVQTAPCRPHVFDRRGRHRRRFLVSPTLIPNRKKQS